MDGETRQVQGKAELVMKVKSDVGLRARAEGLTSMADTDISELIELLDSEGATVEPLFGESEEQLESEAASMTPVEDREVPDLSVYYHIEVDEDKMEALAEKLNELDEVEAAYVKPPAELPEIKEASEAEEAAERAALNDMTPAEETPPATTPDFTSRQGYLDAAPEGIDAHYAWRLAGGRGNGVRIIDIEWGWNFDHEDHRANQGGVVAGVNSTNTGFVNHGTAVIGEMSGDRNQFGVTGICPDAHVSAVSIDRMPTARAIRIAANQLRRGDIMVLEIQRGGPRGRWIPIEWWPDDYDAICYAAARGVLVMEAAGNGGENLDHSDYDNRPSGFPSDWRNPFRRGVADSGAILVGAGAPPVGTHGRNHGPDRSRLGFSNYGSAVDVQGWGREVTSTGYGDLQGGNQNYWYTDQFSGTSSATPIVAGALGCVQGVLRAYGRTPMSPIRTRTLLRQTGSPQQDAPGRPRSERIGNRPDLRELISRAFQSQSWQGVQFRGTVPANSTRRWFTHSWPAQWHVLWSVVPTTPERGGPQVDFDVQVERASHSHITYWITIRNLTSESVDIEARYAVLGQT